MFRLFAAAAAVALAAGCLTADDKKPADKKDETKLAGVWVREVDGLELKMDFSKKDVLVVTAGQGDNALVITSKLTVEKDGKIKAKATKVEVKGEFPVRVADDYEFGFKIKIDGKKATVSDYTASENEEQAKGAVEGEYTLQEKQDK